MQRKFLGLIQVFGVISGAEAVRAHRARAMIVAALLCMASAPGQAALECDQVLAVAQTTIKLRDDGASLSAVMREMESGELRQKLDARELNLLRQIVRMSFTSEASLHEIAAACKAGELGLPKPKPAP
jgi:hypothetical protein